MDNIRIEFDSGWVMLHSMRWSMATLVAFLLVGSMAHATEGRIIKVLPLFLDTKGRESISPSLYDRDAYQAKLRKNPALRSALRFDIQWKARGSNGKELDMIVEVRGAAKGEIPKEIVLEKHVKQSGLFSHWMGIQLAESEYALLGEVTAWRVSLWDGDHLLTEQKSFLW